VDRLSPVAPVEYLKAARSLTVDDYLGVAIAKFDLPDVAAGDINLFSDQRRAPVTRGLFALRDVGASVNLDGCGLGVEVGFEHLLVCTMVRESDHGGPFGT
jgi:hypothetical protein